MKDEDPGGEVYLELILRIDKFTLFSTELFKYLKEIENETIGGNLLHLHEFLL